MPKKNSSSKAPAKTEGTPLAGHEKPFLKPKKSSNEIDEIFVLKKRKKPEGGKKTDKSTREKTAEPKLIEKKKEKKKIKRVIEGDFAELPPPAQPSKRTKDGFVVYTEEELGINKADAGNTPLCPFDCSCCF